MGIVNKALEPKVDAAEPVDQPGAPEELDAPTHPEPARDANEPTDQPGVPDENDSTGGEEEDQPNVSPEEQKIYDVLVTQCLNRIYDPTAFPMICKKLKAGQDNISQAIGHTGAMIMKAIKGSADSAGKAIPDDVMFAAAPEVIGQLCDIAIGIKVMSEDQEKDVSEAAMYEGVRIWGNEMQQNGQIDPNAQSQAQADLNEAGVQQGQPAPAQPPQGGPPPGPPAGIANAGVQ